MDVKQLEGKTAWIERAGGEYSVDVKQLEGNIAWM